MNKPNIFFLLTKVDVAKREVTGIATAESPDLTGEICDYETTKPYYQSWSEKMRKSTGGKSLGNVREMHGNIAAGKVTALDFDDVNKIIRIVTKCVDDSTWNKIQEGVLTGFSQGGEYVKKWKDGEFYRYTADPSEISYVDLPCLPIADFEVIKANGTTEMRKFHVKPAENVVLVPDLEQVWKAKDGKTFATKAEATAHNTLIDARATVAKTTAPVDALLTDIETLLDKRDFTDDERKKAADAGEAMPDGSFPIKSEQDLKNAVRAVGRAADPAKAKEHIIARAKAMSLENLLPADWEGSTQAADKAKDAPMQKDLNTVARAAYLLEELNWLHTSAEMEEAYEQDSNSEAPEQLAEIVKQLCEFLVTYVGEETSEMIEDKGGTGIENPMGTAMMECAAHAPRHIADALAKHSAVFAEILEKAKAAEDAPTDADDADEPAPTMEHVTDIHKAASHIMKRCMKVMGADAEKVLKAMEGGEELHGHLEAIHKKASGICANCIKLGSKMSAEDDAAQQDPDDDKDTQKFMKLVAENGELIKTVTTMTNVLTEIQKRLKVVEDQPAARKGMVMNLNTSGHERDKEPEHSAVEAQTFNMNGVSPAEARLRFQK